MIKCINTFVFFYETFYGIWKKIKNKKKLGISISAPLAVNHYTLDSQEHTAINFCGTLLKRPFCLNRASRAEQHAFIISHTRSEHFLLQEGQKYIKYLGDMRGAADLMLCVFLILAQNQKQSCGLIPMKSQQNRVAGCLDNGTLVFRRVKCVIKRYIHYSIQ